MLRTVALMVMALAATALTGCTAVKMGATSSLPFTTQPENVRLSEKFKDLEIEIKPFDVSEASVSGGHHEGVLQVRQPWIWGLSDEQKSIMYGDIT